MTETKAKIKLSANMKRVVRLMQGGKVLAVHKVKSEANLAEPDYSFHSFIPNKTYHTLLVKGMIKKTDSRTISDIYTLTELGNTISL